MFLDIHDRCIVRFRVEVHCRIFGVVLGRESCGVIFSDPKVVAKADIATDKKHSDPRWKSNTEHEIFLSRTEEFSAGAGAHTNKLVSSN